MKEVRNTTDEGGSEAAVQFSGCGVETKEGCLCDDPT